MDELRQAMSDAYDEAEVSASKEEEASVSHETNEPSTPDVEPETVNEPETETIKEGEEPPTKTATEKEPEPEAEKTGKTKAPASWSPKARESWAKVPPEAQAQIARRETQVAKALQDSSTARQLAQRLNQTLEPFRAGLIQAGANDPFQAINTLLQTEATLRGGSAQGKAQTVANLIKQYGVDIGALDDLLSGQSPRSNPNAQFEQLLDQRLAPVNQFLQQQQANAQQAEYYQQAQAGQTVAEFSQNAEFIADVRNDMADLLDMAAARKQTLSLQQAYDKACAIHPEISQILAKREKEAKIMGNNQSVDAKKRAAASLTGLQGGSGGNPSNGTLRETLNDLWESSAG